VLIRLTIWISALVCAIAIYPALAFNENDVRQVFKTLDEDGDGKVTREEYSSQKIFAIYRNVPPSSNLLEDNDIKFGQTKLSRDFFDASDTDKNGQLSPIEVIDAFHFERIDTLQRGFITIDDLRTFMKKIGS
jgi:Ca2+-binding EF-hand superfamily protein